LLTAASAFRSPRDARDQAVAWMNRGHELLVRGDDPSLAGALEAYNEAITLLRPLPLAENPSWANSLGAALMNRAQLLHRLHGTSQAALALAACDEAEQVLRPLPADANAWPRRNLAGTLVNRANLLLDLGRQAEAADAAGNALVLAAPAERIEPVDAELALKARRALGDALGLLLVAPGVDQEAIARQASDVVDDALELIRHWHSRQPEMFRPLALRFFRYGAQLYRYHQPHFLAEFLEENLPDGDAEFRSVAREVIDAALGDRPAPDQFLIVGDPASERRRQTWQDLRALRARLAQA
jgi:tetratricopeptide (TPR) repeat protein